MKWEKCRRCGSNRVVSRSSGGTGIKLIILSFILFGILNARNTESMVLSLQSMANSLPSIVVGGIGVVLLLFTGRLVCKDCELQWVPKKAMNKKAS
ncbi:hypothetical protein HF078_06880 [Bacillus sp. RO2]|uniref:hypothetical protein n=1 Tax=Bacillus sp. RO2 TaxID=2723913 RepID=UPI00145F6AC7|nr:hypothetical protein [Bacillus sp. RO2]NMH72790.1 hypothetical protein [Bacillus sp. RO2]